MSSKSLSHGYVAIDAEILARFTSSLPQVIASRSRAWHIAWTSKLFVRLAFFVFSLVGLYRLNWSPAVLLAFLAVGTWTAWLCDLLAIWLGSHVWLREVRADSEHAFVLQVLRNLKKASPSIPSSVLAFGDPLPGASLALGGIATVVIGLSWAISSTSIVDALRAEPLALTILFAVFAAPIFSTVASARSAAKGTMAGLTTAGPLGRLLTLWFLMFFCFVAAVNDIEEMRHLIGALYGVGILMTLLGIAALPALWRETAALRAQDSAAAQAP